jgi:tetratricopeptide (TPR) repeat protein
MSGSFILGLLIVAAFLVQSVAAKNPAAAGAVRYGLVLAAVALAAVINPLHLKIYGVVVDLWRNPAFMYFQSWGAPFAYLFPPVLSRHISTLSLVIGALGLIFYRDRLPLAVTIMAVLGALLAVYSHARLSDIFALLAFPFFCLSVSAIGNFIFNALKQKPGLTATQQHKLAAALVIVLSACTLWLLVSNRYYSRHGQACGFGLGAEYDMIPEAAASVIEEHTDATRIFNLPPDGGYLAWRLPGRQIHTDNRAGLYGVDFFRDLLAQFYNGNSAVQHQYLQQWDPDLLVLNTVRPLGEQTVRNIARAGWNPVFIDGTTTVLTQQDPLPPWSESARQAGQNLLDRDFQSYRQDIGGLIKQPLPARLIGAGSTFMALKRYREAAALYAALTRAQPEMAGAWRNLGVCLLEINDPGEAVRTLEKATDLSPRDAIAWFWLSRACKALGADRDAANAWETACRLDPSLPAALQQETAQ